MSDGIFYTIDLSPEAFVALTRHGYDPLLPPRGVTGPPGRLKGYVCGWVDGEAVHFPLRNRVCKLDGIIVDGHETAQGSGGDCIHCGEYAIED